MHELCVDALARLGEDDPVRTARVRAQLVATSNPFGPPEPLDLPPESDDPEAAFLRLQAWHAARFAIDHLPERLTVADRRSSSADGPAPTSTPRGDAAGGWTPTPCSVTGSTWSPSSRRCGRWWLVSTDRPGRSYLLLVEASQRLLEGRYDDASGWSRRPRRRPEGEARFFHLVFTSVVAMQTGAGWRR